MRKLLVATSEDCGKGYGRLTFSLDAFCIILFYLFLYHMLVLLYMLPVYPVSPISSTLRSIQNQATSLGLHC